MFIEECCSEYLSYLSCIKGLSEHTITGYSEDYKLLLGILGNQRDIQEISLNDLRSTIGVLSKKNYSPTSINRYIAAVRGMFAYCKRNKYIPHNPALELKNLKIPKHLPVYMTQNEIDNMCKMPEEKPLLWAARDKAIFEMFYSSGCRVSELALLTFDQLKQDFSSAIITGKGNKQRVVYFEKDAVEALKQYLSERKTRFPQAEKTGGSYIKQVFLNQAGKPLTVNGFQFIVKTYSGPEGTNKPVSPHAFRHTFATQMLNNGADIRMIQKMLGHSSINTTQKYTHISKQELKDIYNQAFPHSGKKN